MKPLVVARSPNPNGWYPGRPPLVGSVSAARLTRLLGLEDQDELARRADLENLFPTPLTTGVPTAGRLRRRYLERTYVTGTGNLAVLLGRDVHRAWGLAGEPYLSVVPTFTERGVHSCRREYDVLLLPHPSGLCRVWNDEGFIRKAEDVLRREFARAELHP